MKLFHVLSAILKSKHLLKKRYPIVRTTTTSFSTNFLKSSLVSAKPLSNKVNSKFLHTDSDTEESFEDFLNIETERENKNVRYTVFKDYEDKIIKELNSCVSVEEVLNLITKYKNSFKDRHILQTILVLIDLQTIYFHYNGLSQTNTNKFLENLKKNVGFNSLLESVQNALDKFDPNYLTYVIYYLTKLGVAMEDTLMQNIALKIQNNLLENFYLDQCSRFLTAIFYEKSVRPYYLSLPVAPSVMNSIETCNSVSDLYNLTICLNKFHNLVTAELLERYKAKVTEFLDNGILKGAHHSTLLKIMLLLNYPEWRNKNILLISNCLLLMKDEITLLSVEDLAILYEIFFKNQEPGLILNNIQRCSAKYLNRLDEETGGIGIVTRLKLFSSLIYFSSPLHRTQFRSHMQKYLNICESYTELILLRKLFSYVKVSNRKLCANYWNSFLKILDEDVDENIVLKLCQNYTYFNTDINNYRHYPFESKIIDIIRQYLLVDPFLNPAMLSTYLSFILLYGKSEDNDLLTLLLNKFTDSVNRISASDCIKLSHSISLLYARNTSYVPEKQIESTKMLLNNATKYLFETDEDNYVQNSVLIKAHVLRNDSDDELLEKLFEKYKQINLMSSKIIENISHVCTATQILIPELINKCIEYIIKYRDHIIGFNAEKILFLCYYLNYHPIDENKFFEVATDLIIRDQERLSGLAFLQSALSLSYFNKLPSSFVKHIFNVEFLDKLDKELDNCYSKDKYPHRVRKVLMMLNRSVCLEYPEYNVPWFHKKYMEDTQKFFLKKTDGFFQQRVREYLSQVLRTQEHIEEHVVTPYGYHINFVINLNDKEEVVPSNSADVSRRVAMLLLRSHAFTRFHVNLKGEYKLQKRHLEIFGYEVVVVNFLDWMRFVHSEEHLEYISNLIWPSGRKKTNDVISR